MNFPFKSFWVSIGNAGLIGILSFVALGSVMFATEEKGNTLEQTDERFLSALERLSQLSTSGRLIESARQIWKADTLVELASHYRWGDSSRTDTILTRHFNTRTGKEERVRSVMIYLREDESDIEMMMDMVHELVHATSRPAFDPYDPKLTPGRYILAAIEGVGGEVEAVAMECQVAGELNRRIPHQCRDYMKIRGNSITVDRERIKSDFYRVGKWYSDLLQEIGIEARLFPRLSVEVPKFFSSTGHAPYPAALLKEFQDMTWVACENSRKRILNLSGRLSSEEKNQAQFLSSRCMASGAPASL